jgi:hypothetical protein
MFFCARETRHREAVMPGHWLTLVLKSSMKHSRRADLTPPFERLVHQNPSLRQLDE